MQKDILEEYENGKKIGKGGNGLVYRYIRKCDLKTVAVKIIEFDSPEKMNEISKEAEY